MQKRKLEELNLLDDFLFGSMVTHPEVGESFVRELLKIIFGREFGRLKVIPQKPYYGKDAGEHGARLDVYIEDSAEETESPYDEGGAGVRAKCSDIYDIEPESKSKKSTRNILPRRVRFYHAVIDAQSLRSGTDYDCLKNVTVIMIVPFDPFGYDRMVYTIARRCREEPDMLYDDGSVTLYLYTRGKRGNPPEELRELLEYMEETTWENAVNEDLQAIQQMVEIVKKDEEVSIAYMKSWERDAIIREEGREEEKTNTERERQRAEVERQRAEEASQRAEAESQKAKEADQRAKQAEEKVKKLMEELERLKKEG